MNAKIRFSRKSLFFLTLVVTVVMLVMCTVVLMTKKVNSIQQAQGYDKVEYTKDWIADRFNSMLADNEKFENFSYFPNSKNIDNSVVENSKQPESASKKIVEPSKSVANNIKEDNKSNNSGSSFQEAFRQLRRQNPNK